MFSNPTLEAQARAVCRGNIRCLFDIKITGDVEIGNASVKATEELVAAVNETEKKGK